MNIYKINNMFGSHDGESLVVGWERSSNLHVMLLASTSESESDGIKEKPCATTPDGKASSLDISSS